MLGSSTLIYRAYAFSGFVFYEYGSYSLSLYYFDRAFKCFYDRDDNYYLFEKHLEVQLYKAVTRIFLNKTRYNEAKNFAFKLLRKSWLLGDVDEEIAAYDLLGKIYMELQQITMSRYFHYRMAAGER
jgi:tetratricopeptide (TPR) repeat protein